MVMEILYPVAYVQPYEAVHIEDAQRGRSHFCFGCRGEMVIRRGSKRRWHFAHKASFVQCEKYNALHEAAKAFICQGFRRAVATGGEYRIGYPCGRCEIPISRNIASGGASIASEKMVVKGTRSDLAVLQPGGSPRIIIEIVVTHDLESDTEQKYQAVDCPVITVEPSWDTLLDLERSAIGSRILNLEGEHRYCGNCRAARKQEMKATVQASKTWRRRMSVSVSDDAAKTAMETVFRRGPRSPYMPQGALTEEDLMQIPPYVRAKERERRAGVKWNKKTQ